MVVLDTSIVSAIMHRLPEAMSRLEAHRPNDVVLCSPVAAEIHYGLARMPARSRRRRTLEAEYLRLRDAVGWSDWTEPAALEFGQQKARLERLGERLDDTDIVVGSVALSVRAAVATRNVRHFARIEGLTVDDWTRPA